MSLLGPQSFKSPHHLNNQYYANFSILPADQIKKWIEENQKKEVCTGEMGKRQTTQSTTELWNLMQTDFGQGQSTSGRLLGWDDERGREAWTTVSQTGVKAPCRDMLPYPHRTQHRSAGSDITPGTQLPPPHPFPPLLARNQEWNYFSMWFHTKIKNIYTSLPTTQHRHGIADFRTVPLTTDWATLPPPNSIHAYRLSCWSFQETFPGRF